MQLTPDDLTMVLGDLTMSLTTVFPLIKLFWKMGLFFFPIGPRLLESCVGQKKRKSRELVLGGPFL